MFNDTPAQTIYITLGHQTKVQVWENNILKIQSDKKNTPKAVYIAKVKKKFKIESL